MPSEPSRIRWKDNTPQNQPEEQGAGRAEVLPVPSSRGNTPILNQIGRDLTLLARAGRLPPLFGRQKELKQIQRILLRKQKSNPILIGAPGVGKTALVEGLAIQITSGSAVPELQNARIIEIIPSSLVAGTAYRGVLESRLQSLLEEVKQTPNIILFIDEIHTLIGAGSVGDGSLDVANIFKPALARGEIRCIGATTLDEFDKFIKSDPAFERRFDRLILDEPTESETIEIIKSAVNSYEDHHHVKILPEAVESAVRLSSQHILDRRLPDKAFDLLDAACAFVRLPDISRDHTDTDQLLVNSDAVSHVLAEKLNIPVEKLSQDFREKLSGLEEALNQKIIGQSLAEHRIASAIVNAYAGLNRPDQPRCVFAFFGASGVGKTATAEVLAEWLFQSPEALIRLDMSGYKEPHSISRLFGAPPGYIGFDDEGTFATRLRRQPFSIVLLDEVEKAHPQVHDAFLHIFDEGRFIDARGRNVDARHTIFILTSNLFTLTEINSSEEYETHAASIRQSLVGYFRPEFINRINEIVLFRELDVEDLKKIARLEIQNLNLRLSQYQVNVVPNEEALCWIANQANDPKSGARSVSRIVQKFVAEPISTSFVAGALPGPRLLEVIVQDNDLIISGL